jgi:cytosine deaminase
MDLILRKARLSPELPLMDIGIQDGRIAVIEPTLAAEAPEIDAAGHFVCGGLIESHIHLDKPCILDRTEPEPARFPANPVGRTSLAKHSFTEQDVYDRASRVLARAVTMGTTRMRTHVELDPIVGLRSLAGVRRAIADWAWAIDVEISVFAEEGLTNNPGTDELLVAAMESGIRVIGGAPSSDTDRAGQLLRVFELARRYDADIDLHIDFGNSPDDMDLDLVCRLTERDRRGGRVTVAHVTKLTTHARDSQRRIARRLAELGITLSVLPATDLFLMGRDQTDNIRRGVVNAHMLLEEGCNATIATNNIVNAFTPFGDGSLIRLVNMYAHIAQVSTDADIQACFDMLTTRAARMLNQHDYGVAVGNPADLVMFDAGSAVELVREIRQPMLALKRGERTMTWERPKIIKDKKGLLF